MEWQVIQYGELSEEMKKDAVDIFIDGFGHLLDFTKDTAVLRRLIPSALNPEYIYAVVEENKVLGLLGLATNKVRPIKINRDVCIEIFGKFKGKLLTKQLNAIFQSKVVEADTDLYIDVLATAKDSRGKGVATRLLQYSFELEGYKDYYIEVLSKNTNAKRLYEKTGFVEYKSHKWSPLTLKGYGYPIEMCKLERGTSRQ